MYMYEVGRRWRLALETAEAARARGSICYVIVHHIIGDTTLFVPCSLLFTYTYILCVCIYIYMDKMVCIITDVCINIHMYVYIYIYTHTYTDRERERERDVGLAPDGVTRATLISALAKCEQWATALRRYYYVRYYYYYYHYYL